jgi:hypothetical protein
MEVIKRKDKLYIGQVFTQPITHGKEEVVIYKSKEAVVVVLAQYKQLLGWRTREVSRLELGKEDSWKYIEVRDNRGNVIPLIYGFTNIKNKNAFYIKVKNEYDRLDKQPFSNLVYGEQIWNLLLSSPTKNRDAFKIMKSD